MTPEERLNTAVAIVRELPGDGADQLTIVMLAMTMAMRLASGRDEEKYARLVQSAIKLMGMAPPLTEIVELH